MQQDSQEGLIKGYFPQQSFPQDYPNDDKNKEVKREIQRNLPSNDEQLSKKLIKEKKFINKEGQIDLSEFYSSQQKPGTSKETLGQSNRPILSVKILDSENLRSQSNNKGCKSKKNIIKYIIDITTRIMFNYKGPSNVWKDKCKKSNIKYKQFEAQYTKIIQKITGLQNTYQLFIIDKADPKEITMKQIFKNVFQKILRKRYMIYLLKKGKMKDDENYIEIKNKRLLYLSYHFRSVMEKSYT